MEKNKGRRIGVINRDVAVFTFFLLLSFVLWYLNYLGKETEADIRLPLKIVNIPNGRVLSGDIPPKVSITLTGTGFSIMKLKYPGNKASVTVDLSRVLYKRVPESKSPDYYIVTSGLLKTLTLQLRSGCDVTSVRPDTLFFTMKRAEIKAPSK